MPDRRLSRRFRRRFCNALERLIKTGTIELPTGMARINALKQINLVRRKKWIVDVRERYDHGHGVATYLARYFRGRPNKTQRLCRFDGRTVSFRISRRGENRQDLDLPVTEFIRRILLHVPPNGYRAVQSCGLYHQFYAKRLEACRRQLGGGGLQEEPESPEGSDGAAADEEWATEIEFCRVCGFQLEIEAIPRAPPPPALAIYYGVGR